MKRILSLLLPCFALALAFPLRADSPREAMERQERRVAELALEKSRDPAVLSEYLEAVEVLKTYRRWCAVGDGKMDAGLVLLTGVVAGRTPYQSGVVRWTGPWYTLAGDFRTIGFSGRDPGIQPGSHIYAFGTMWFRNPSVFEVDSDYCLVLSPSEYDWLRTGNTEEEIQSGQVASLLEQKASEIIPGSGRRGGWTMSRRRHSVWRTVVWAVAGLLGLLVVAILLAVLLSGRKHVPDEYGKTPGTVPPAPVPPPEPAPNPVHSAPVPPPVAPVAAPPPPPPSAPFRPASPSVAPAPRVEVCPHHRVPLVDGNCPYGCTIVRCSQCNTILHDGHCPNGCKEPELCPTCGSPIYANGTCPNQCTIVRCSQCGVILRDGLCPHGCNADPMRLGWPGGVRPPMSGFSLALVEPEAQAGLTVDVPCHFVIGRSALNAREPFLELYTASTSGRAACSRRYVEMTLSADQTGFDVRLLTGNNTAMVGGHRLETKGQCEKLSVGAVLHLHPDFGLKLVSKKP